MSSVEGVLESAVEVRSREDIPVGFKWNAESVFEGEEALEAEVSSLRNDLAKVAAYQGKLNEGPETLALVLSTVAELVIRSYRIVMYTYVGHAVNTEDQPAAELRGKAQALFGEVAGTVAFLNPELLELGQTTIDQWVMDHDALAQYQHYFDNLFRKQQHVRSTEVEQILGTLTGVFASARTTAESLADADLTFQAAIGSDGEQLPVTQGTLRRIYRSSDREARRTAWESYADGYLAFQNTLASNLAGSIRQNVFQAQARRHESSVAASLFEWNIPVEVYHNLIETFRKHLDTWHRYFAVKRRGLAVEKLQPYDVWAPLTDASVPVPYAQALEWTFAGLAPMGEEYVSAMRKGCLEQRWIDVYPNKGKRQGAFSFGTPGTHPFIVMNYNDNVLSLSTLSHELGHSMHSYLAWANQPPIYAQYSIFAAEVASNFHQAMLRSYLLREADDPALKIELIDEAMSNFYRYFLIMPTLARFELETHERIERGEGLNAENMTKLMADLFREPYGDELELDDARVGITWAQFLHLYSDYYVYQYATGIAGAHTLSNRILKGEENAVEDYLGFLKAGGSEYPIEALKAAGVDLSSPEPVEQTFAIMADYVDQLEELLSGEAP
jgi:oligoendopeptidase F